MTPKRFIERLLLAGAVRRRWWDKALATADGDKDFAVKLLGVSYWERGDFCTINAAGLLWNEEHVLDEKCIADVERNVDSLVRDFNNELLYGPHERYSYDDAKTIRMWSQFLDESYGDLDEALAVAHQHGWMDVPAIFLEWRNEKELLFGPIDIWKAALVDVDGDVRRAAELLGLARFDARCIVYMLGLRWFAEQCRKPAAPRFIVYGLRDCASGEVRWVGQSRHGLKRPRALIGPRNVTIEKCGCGDWLRELAGRDEQPEIVVLEECATVNELNDAERRHIAIWREKIGVRLTNIRKGGAASSATVVRRQDAAGHSDSATTRLYDRQWRGRKAFEMMPEAEDLVK